MTGISVSAVMAYTAHREWASRPPDERFASTGDFRTEADDDVLVLRETVGSHDSPSTMTLHASTFADVVGFAADPITHDELRGRTPARLVLVEAMEFAWQRARYRGNQHLFLRADPVLSASTPSSTTISDDFELAVFVGKRGTTSMPEVVFVCQDCHVSLGLSPRGRVTVELAEPVRHVELNVRV